MSIIDDRRYMPYKIYLTFRNISYMFSVYATCLPYMQEIFLHVLYLSYLSYSAYRTCSTVLIRHVGFYSTCSPKIYNIGTFRSRISTLPLSNILSLVALGPQINPAQQSVRL